MSAVDALILALADGRTMREAAAIARIPSAQATREAREVGWPDLDAIRLAAEEIRDRHTTPPLSREETPVPPRKPEPIPIEADVEQAIPADLDRVVDRTDDVEASVDPIDRVLMDDTAALLQTLERVTAAVQDRPLEVLTVEQVRRAVALREVTDLVLGGDPGPTVGDLLALTDYIITGVVPVLIVRGVAQPGERAS